MSIEGFIVWLYTEHTLPAVIATGLLAWAFVAAPTQRGKW